MNSIVITCIDAARTGKPMGKAAIAELIHSYLDGQIPDYQMAAWLMAITCQGMNPADTTALTTVLAATGDHLNLRELAPFVADKHSTGGIGDNTTLVLAPLLAAVGIPIGKLTGRALGHHGGTVDKLEAITGLQLPTTASDFTACLRATGIGLSGQSDHLAPGDGALYALRDVTGTVASLPLIASSIMSKKLAAGANAVVLDVKTGPGAVLTDPNQSLELARLMIDIGDRAGLPTRAVISDMTQPLGHAIGNTLEVTEAIHALSGQHVPGLTDLSLTIARLLAETAWPDHTPDVIDQTLRTALTNGSALACLRRWVEHLGGDVRQIDDPTRLPTAEVHHPVTATVSGLIHAIDAAALGRITAELGAGRVHSGDRVDPATGIVLRVRVGDHVRAGDVLADLHLRPGHDSEAIERRAAVAFTIGPGPVCAPPVIHHVL